jgi:MSHA biogenesis protein MshJ
MKQQLEALLARIDAMSLRERVFLFLSVLACCLALADALWLSPAVAAHKKLVQQFTTQTTELGHLRDELRALAQPVDASKVVREDIAAANQRMDSLNDDINTLLPRSQDGPALEQVLVQFLHRQTGLTLLALNTLPTEGATAVAPAASTAPGAPQRLPAGLIRRGLELRVSGPYAELMRYVRKLETALPTLRWGSLVLKSDSQLPELTLQVFVLGVQPL